MAAFYGEPLSSSAVTAMQMRLNDESFHRKPTEVMGITRKGQSRRAACRSTACFVHSSIGAEAGVQCGSPNVFSSCQRIFMQALK